MRFAHPIFNQRSGGVLMHVTSLPGSPFCGDLGPECRHFIRFLEQAGQHWWQMLPVHPSDGGYSPYNAISTFAGNPLLVSPEGLKVDGLIRREPSPPAKSGRADFKARHRLLDPVFDEAWDAFQGKTGNRLRPAFQRFKRRNAAWLGDFALFAVLREKFGGKSWHKWPQGLRSRESAELRKARNEHADKIERAAFVQFVFDRQWQNLRRLARSAGIRLLGDLPFYVSYESSDVWANPALFLLDRDGSPRAIAGVPPDYFSASGQLWGNPLYDWERSRRTGYAWWIQRLEQALARFDAVRLDHFIGFHRSWAVPPKAKTARKGRFVRGSQAAVFDALRRKRGAMPFIAEDLGLVTHEVVEMREKLGFPGMRVLQFAFDDETSDNIHMPHTYGRDTVAYPGTHDNNTALGWFRGLDAAMRAEVMDYLGCADRDAVGWALIRAVFQSRANLVIVPMQDLLGLGSESRMNYPGKAAGNWAWRMRKPWPAGLADRLRRLTHSTGR